MECPVGLSKIEICAHFNDENLVQIGRSAKKKIVDLCGF